MPLDEATTQVTQARSIDSEQKIVNLLMLSLLILLQAFGELCFVFICSYLLVQEFYMCSFFANLHI